MTRLRTGQSHRRHSTFIPESPDGLWGPHSLILNGQRCSSEVVGWPGRDVDHWFPTSARLRMSGVIPLLSLFSRISLPTKSKKRNILYYIYIYIYTKAAIVISSYKTQQSIRNLNDNRLNAIATTANLH